MAYFFIIAAIVLRLVPHLPNFAPIAALALFGGVYLGKKYALIIPIVAMFISDMIIGFYNPWIMASVYASFILIGCLGLWLKNNKSVPNVLGASLFGSIIFFVVTNFAVWAVPHSMYAHTISGIVQCYVSALPFLRNTILGDLFYVVTIFGLYEIVVKVVAMNKNKQRARVRV